MIFISNTSHVLLSIFHTRKIPRGIVIILLFIPQLRHMTSVPLALFHIEPRVASVIYEYYLPNRRTYSLFRSLRLNINESSMDVKRFHDRRRW